MKLLYFVILGTLVFASPSEAGVSITGSLARTTTIQPGDAFEGVIFLNNPEKEPADIRVSQCDYLYQADGSDAYGEAGKATRSNAGWFTVTPARVKLFPGETLPIRYKGRVPANSALHGTFWSMIIVEANTAPSILPERQLDKMSVSVKTTIRFGVEIVTEVGQGGMRSLKVVDVRGEGQCALHLDIANDGERLVTPAITVELFDMGGASIGRFETGRSRIYPACSIRAKVDITDVPAGKYTAVVLLDIGDAQVEGAQYDLEITEPDAAKDTPLSLIRK